MTGPTELKPSVGDSEALPENNPYNVYRKYRPDGYVGSLLLNKSNIISEPVDKTTNRENIFRKMSAPTGRPCS